MIIFFTGTGNSRYAAQAISDMTGDEITDSLQYLKNGEKAAFESANPWVFVSPTYSWRIPVIFESFIRKSTFSGNRDAYFIMTCGDDIGNAGAHLKRLCDSKGLNCKGVAGIVMPENYVAMFAVPGEDESRAIRSRALPHLKAAADSIKAGSDLSRTQVNVPDRLKSGIVNSLFYSLFVKSKAFRVSDKCTGCGKCEKRCPVNGIRLENKKPVWTGDCTHCMSCICGCPAGAIEYGKVSVGKPRYQCPEYK